MCENWVYKYFKAHKPAQGYSSKVRVEDRECDWKKLVGDTMMLFAADASCDMRPAGRSLSNYAGLRQALDD